MSAAESSPPPIDVEVRDLHFGWGADGFALRVPRLELPRGQQVALIGPSGAGKTTLLNLLAGILVPQRGAVQIRGQALSSLPDPARRAFRINHIGLVFQEFELLEHLSVRENILLPYFLNRELELSTAVEARLLQVAASLEIEALLRRRPRVVSHGERQRVAICRALLQRPSLLLVDEPTGNLDPERSCAVMALLSAQAREDDATLVVVTHDHSLLESLDAVHDIVELAQGGEA